jgi:hypothetical protein
MYTHKQLVVDMEVVLLVVIVVVVVWMMAVLSCMWRPRLKPWCLAALGPGSMRY